MIPTAFQPEYPAPFIVNHLRYRSFEHFLLAERACVDESLWEEILMAKSDFGRFKDREIANFNQEEWEKEEYEVYLAGTHAKFTQNEELGDALVESGSEEFSDGTDKNMLGQALMKVRGMLRQVDPIESFGMYPPEK